MSIIIRWICCTVRNYIRVHLHYYVGWYICITIFSFIVHITYLQYIRAQKTSPSGEVKSLVEKGKTIRWLALVPSIGWKKNH
jgi:hypothetical protein